jgi:hypothetical protein
VLCLSWMRRKSHVRFLGGDRPAMACPYPPGDHYGSAPPAVERGGEGGTGAAHLRARDVGGLDPVVPDTGYAQVNAWSVGRL